jgi:protein farnesyltransferase/geranylgeranyltransferase type-1 subunit alpha
VEWTSDFSRELAFTEAVLRGDSKNYHAWQHRQWTVEKFDLFNDKEVIYSTQLLAEDPRLVDFGNIRMTFRV